MIGCLVIPYFAASVTRQAQPELARTPLIFARETTPGAQVRAVSREAYHAGRPARADPQGGTRTVSDGRGAAPGELTLAGGPRTPAGPSMAV